MKIERQKEIWQRCFGDEQSYIDFFYANRYREDETLLLLQDDEIAAMMTIIPVDIAGPARESLRAAMLYAVATHPDYQNKGLGSQLLNSAIAHLAGSNIDFSLVVPAERRLFAFYRKLGYREGFFLRESRLTPEMIARLSAGQDTRVEISAVPPAEYNRRRNAQLNDRLYVQYADRDISYQKMLSHNTGADIYGIDAGEERGCMVLERISAEKVFVKEILLSEKYLHTALQHMARTFAAQEYIVRTPAYRGEGLGGLVRPFAMVRPTKAAQTGGCRIADGRSEDAQAYLGLAFD